MAAEPPILSQALGFVFLGLLIFCIARPRRGRGRGRR